MKTQSPEIQRLIEVLILQRKRLGSWLRLSEAIYLANDLDSSRRIDRRTLEKLCDEVSTDVQLKIGQLLAIEHWLSLQDEGPLFARQRSLLDSVRESYNVNFLMGAAESPDLHTEVVSRWDLRATTRLMRTPLNRLHLGIWDVTGPENWREQDVRIVNAANLAIGSAVASYASDVLMSRMTGIAPEESVSMEKLPFFIVGCDRDESLRRNFVRRRSELAATSFADQLPASAARRALVVNNKWYVSNENEDYGLLLAQRNPATGHVQMVLSGLTGRATYQLARIVQSGLPAQTMPALEAGQDHPPILLAIYRLTLGTRDAADSHAGADRNGKLFVDSTAVDSPTLLHYVDGAWAPGR